MPDANPAVEDSAGTACIVTANTAMVDYLRTVLDFSGYRCQTIDPARDYGGQVESLGEGFCFLVCDADLAEEQRTDLSRWLDEQELGWPVLMASHRDAGEAARFAGRDYLGSFVWPTSQSLLEQLVERAKEAFQKQRASRPPRARRRAAADDGFRDLCGESARMQQVKGMIRQVAASDATVLVLGESGTGKEVVARQLHLHSARSQGPFVPVNCGAIPADLLESELFGHEKGAFTGAISARQGRFELARGGTLFLDEIGDMSMPMQVKLLRVLQERTFERVGSNRTLEADVRIIAATHRDLEQAISDNRFREDLFYRLNVFPIDMPPLRDRLDDLPLLARVLAERTATACGAPVRLTAPALQALRQYAWPGNVRELANLMERLTILYPGQSIALEQLPEKYLPDGMTLDQLPPQIVEEPLPAPAGERPQDLMETLASGGDEWTDVGDDAGFAAGYFDAARFELPEQGLDLKNYMAELEQEIIRQALGRVEGVVAQAAKLLQMRRTTLVEKLKKYGI